MDNFCNVSPRIITEGFDKAKEKALAVLDEMKIELTEGEKKEILTAVSRSELCLALTNKYMCTTCAGLLAHFLNKTVICEKSV